MNSSDQINRQSIIPTFDSVGVLRKLIDTHKWAHIKLFHGSSSFSKYPFHADLEKLLREAKVESYTVKPSDLNVETISKIVRQAKTKHWDAVVAIGGGSVIDMAKIISFLVRRDVSIEAYLKCSARNVDIPKQTILGASVGRSNDKASGAFRSKRFAVENVSKSTLSVSSEEIIWPFIAIPTTFGTGSESTQFATFYRNQQKQSMDHPSLMPSIAILDSHWTTHLKGITFSSVLMDAFVQAIESYWSANATDESLYFATQAILAFAFFFENEDCLNPSIQQRMALLLGSNASGRAIQLTKTTACHALSYPMTAHFGVPHGIAVFLTMPGLFHFILKANDPKKLRSNIDSDQFSQRVSALKTLLGFKTPEDAQTYFVNLANKLKINRSLRSYGIDEKHLSLFVQDAFAVSSRMGNYPYQLEQEDVYKILKDAL
ncbi:MAG: iron-containing alcohol dehydrogenase [Bdellovibrionales bacterium]|nr:iron-containing alcohol dehydrogenase [Bdellovibrionales bacterium]